MKKTNLARRLSYISSALALSVATVMPSLMGGIAHAFPNGAQVTSRKITMSSSKTSDTGVTYEVSFKAASSFTVKGIVVDFCANSPIIGDATCTAPSGFTVGASPTVTVSSGISGGTWASGATSVNSGRTLKIHDSTGNALTGGTTVVTFTISGVTNTSTLGTFYGRIVTYTDDTAGTSEWANYAPGSEGSTTAKDYGGVALSTANVLTVTAKVQESLIFCVMTSGASCAAASGASVSLGDANGVLSSYSTNYTGNATFDVASNAQGGVSVTMKGENLCRVASPCANTDSANIINRSGDTCTADVTTTGTEQFGMRISTFGSGVSSGTYNCAASNHRFNRTNTTSTYGDVIATTAGPGDEVQSTMEFMAKAATTSEAGIYTTALNFIATGTY